MTNESTVVSRVGAEKDISKKAGEIRIVCRLVSGVISVLIAYF